MSEKFIQKTGPPKINFPGEITSSIPLFTLVISLLLSDPHFFTLLSHPGGIT
jgi:hypothetical protein